MKKISLLLAFLGFIGLQVVFAQTREIAGVVTSSEDGSSVPGASVVVKGTTLGTVTDMDGKFTLKVPQNTSAIIVSFVGMVSAEVAITGSSNYAIKLKSESISVDEVVVTAFGIKRSEKSLGYSTAKMDPNDGLMKSNPDFLKSMQGKLAGVDIRSSQGTPGAATRINIRGNSSFYGSNQPLIIVDGVPLSNDQVTTSSQTSGGGAYSDGFSSLDPNDIASLSVLKGSAAAALYGSRASNGVIMIKTKSGSVNDTRKKMEVTLSSSWSVETIANLPEYQNKYGAGSNGAYSNSNGSWGPAFGTVGLDSIPIQNAAWTTFYPTLFSSTKNVPYQAYPNNVKDLFRTGLVSDNSLNIAGGNGKTAYNATLSHMNHKGYVPNSSYKRSGMSVGGSSQLLNGLNVRGSVSYTNTDQLGSVFGENQVEGASSSFARALFLARNWDIAGRPFETPTGLPISTNNSQYDNPLWAFKHNTVATKVDRSMANMGADYKILPWLTASYQLGTNIYSLNRREVIDLGSRALGGKGQLKTDQYRSAELESNLVVTAQKDFMEEKFSVKLSAGHNLNQRYTARTAMQGSELGVPNIYTLSNTKTQTTLSDNTSKRRLMGVFGDLTLGYKNYAFVTATGRNDWSSTLPIDNRSYFYPSVSGTFIFSDAFELKNDFFSYGKLRAGWAKVGRDASPYALVDTYDLYDPFNGQARAGVPTTSNNINLEPEFTEETELGAQLEFFSRRLALDFTWYNKISTNQIAAVGLPYSSGYQSYFTNFGKIQNKGVEIDLSGKILQSKDFLWSAHLTFTQNKNTVLELIEGVDRIQLSGVLTGISPYLEKGMPFGYLRGTTNYRDDQGNLLIDPKTGLLIPDPTETMVGDPNPKFKLGLNTTITYKNFFVTGQFDWREGGDFYSVTINSLLGRGVTRDTEDREHTWVIPGFYGNANTGAPILDNAGQKIPNTIPVTTNDLYFGNSFAINATTDFSIYDATVYRFREFTFGYNLPQKLLTRTPFGSASVSFSGYNLWHFAPNVPKYTNFDPEVNSFGSTSVQGIELSAAPSSRRFGFNLKLSF
jgi:TonB-linked SusC/RagA family outer membrane protein